MLASIRGIDKLGDKGFSMDETIWNRLSVPIPIHHILFVKSVLTTCCNVRCMNVKHIACVEIGLNMHIFVHLNDMQCEYTGQM